MLFFYSMGVYDGYSYFRQGGGRIVKSNMSHHCHGSLGVLYASPKQYFITINRADSIDEQVKTLIHEFLHLSLENRQHIFDDPFGEQRGIIEEEEHRVMKETEMVYQMQPNLVEHLRKVVLTIS